MRQATERIQDRIADLYASGLGELDRALGELDEEVMSFKFAKARSNAWRTGTALADAPSDSAKGFVAGTIDAQTATLARLTLTPRELSPWLLEALEQVEQQRDRWPDAGDSGGI